MVERWQARGGGLALLALVMTAAPAQADWRDRLAAGADRLGEATAALALEAERAVIIGGIVVYRYRHTIAGALLGCAAGAAAGAGAGLAGGGAILAGPGPMMALGCGAGGLAGAQIGWPLDHAFERE